MMIGGLNLVTEYVTTYLGRYLGNLGPVEAVDVKRLKLKWLNLEESS